MPKLKQIVTSFETVLIASKGIKTKHSYILAIEAKNGVKFFHKLTNKDVNSTQ